MPTDDTRALPVSTFLTFAMTCQSARFVAGVSGLGPTDGQAQKQGLSDDERDGLFVERFNELCKTAERHARLLAQIEQWADADPDPDRTVAMSDGEWRAKAHIKALLEQR